MLGKNIVQAKAWLDKCYVISFPLKSTIAYWYAQFWRGHTSTEDTERSGCSKEAALAPSHLSNARGVIFIEYLEKCVTVYRKNWWIRMEIAFLSSVFSRPTTAIIICFQTQKGGSQERTFFNEWETDRYFETLD